MCSSKRSETAFYYLEHDHRNFHEQTQYFKIKFILNVCVSQTGLATVGLAKEKADRYVEEYEATDKKTLQAAKPTKSIKLPKVATTRCNITVPNMKNRRATNKINIKI